MGSQRWLDLLWASVAKGFEAIFIYETEEGRI